MSPPPRPEILAPAGDRDALSAALAAGADAVYFGLDDGFNARARAENFPSDGLAEVIAQVHRAGARAYVALNTLVFEPELPVVEELIRRIAAAGVDAIIVQDPAVCLLARAVCPQLEVHGSTQMTASSGRAVQLLADLGLTRVVVPRELSVPEIARYQEEAAGAGADLEVFVHGALCVAWSGQCLSSEAWGGRSANRGQCAQACRLPYQLVVDGEVRELGEVAYLLSPKDLFGIDEVGALAALGVASLKIEGRLKGPAYVATAAAQYRRAVDPAWQPRSEVPMDRAALETAYSRGASRGFLGGADHQTLVEGRFPRHRGLPLGRVRAVEGDTVIVAPDAAQRPVTGGAALDGDGGGDAAAAAAAAAPIVHAVRAGMGVVFDRGVPEDDEQGGPIFGVEALEDAGRGGGWRLRFGTPGPDLRRVSAGDFVWISSDPRVTRAGERAVVAGRGPLGRLGVTLRVSGAAGEPLRVEAITARGHVARAATPMPLAAAQGAGLTDALLADKLGAFGGTAFHAAAIERALPDGLHVPVSALKELRRQLVAALDVEVARVDRTVARESVLPQLRAACAVTAAAADGDDADRDAAPRIVPLVRDDAQLDAVLDAGAREVELDWMELVGLARAAERARARGARVVLATPRVQKPGEDKIDAHLARLLPDALLVRSWGAIHALREAAPDAALHGDFSLNLTNALSAGWALQRGLATITAAHDLDRDQLLALLAAAPRGRVAVTVHHHIPTFHTEHCVYAHLLSRGADYRTCGRPCEQHRVALRDRVGLVHPVVVDVGCRNTVFNAQAQSAASLVPELIARGVRRLRVELVRETGAEAHRVYTAYAALAAGRASAADTARTVAVHEQFGVTRGSLIVLR